MEVKNRLALKISAFLGQDIYLHRSNASRHEHDWMEYDEGKFSVFLGSLVKEHWKIHLDQETKKHPI